jgi:predicted RNA-binding Zn ribbon-like protein
MLHVTWAWIGIAEPALDLANTVAVSKGVPHDLLALEGEFGRWAAAAAQTLPHETGDPAELAVARSRLLSLREEVRELLASTTADQPLSGDAVAAVNGASRGAPSWLELVDQRTAVLRTTGSTTDRILAHYARSAIEIVAEGAARLSTCPAPSCGMFFRPHRAGQRWCSKTCGTRARVARHYQTRQPARDR